MSLFSNIIWPILGSSGIASVLVFLLKKNIERKIEHRFKQLEVTQKLHFEEVYRRQGKLFDEQYSNYKILTATTYRLKNAANAIYDLIIRSSSPNNVKDQVRVFKACEHLLSETLYTDKLIMEETYFSMIHDLKHACAAFLQTARFYELEGKVKDLEALKRLKDKIEEAHFEALSMYKRAIENPPATLKT